MALLIVCWCPRHWVRRMMDSVDKLGVSSGILTLCMRRSPPAFLTVSVTFLIIFLSPVCGASVPNLIT